MVVLALDNTEFFGTIVETGLYGMYLLSFPATLYILLNRNKPRDASGKRIVGVNKFLVGMSIFIFILCTTHCVLDISRLTTAYVTRRSDPKGGILFYANLKDPRNVLRNVIFVLQLVSLDVTLAYRVWIIWNKTLYIIFPLLLCIAGTITSGVAVCVLFATTPHGDVFEKQLTAFITGAFTTSLGTNVLAISFISYRIIKRERAMKNVGTTSLMSLLVIMCESAALYCVINLMTTVSLLVHSEFQFVGVDLLSPITGISFSLIVLRVGLPSLFSRPYTTQPSSRSSRKHFGGGERSEIGSAIPMQIQIARDRDFVVVANNAQKDSSTFAMDPEDTMVHKSDGDMPQWK